VRKSERQNTKPRLAGVLLERAHSRGIRAAFAVGDEVYGGRELRRSIRQLGMGYVMAVRANHGLATSPGHTITAAAAARMIPAHAWHRMRTGSGMKGIRHYDWAVLEVTSDDTPDGHDDGHSVLLIRRHRYTGTLSFYRCWTPGPVALSRLIGAAVFRRLPRRRGKLGGIAAGTDTQILAFTLIGAVHHLVITSPASLPDLPQRVRRIVAALIVGMGLIPASRTGDAPLSPGAGSTDAQVSGDISVALRDACPMTPGHLPTDALHKGRASRGWQYGGLAGTPFGRRTCPNKE